MHPELIYLEILTVLYFLYSAQLCRATLNDPLILLDREESFFGSSEISLPDGAIIQFVREQPWIGINGSGQIIKQVNTSSKVIRDLDFSPDLPVVDLNCTLRERRKTQEFTLLDSGTQIKLAIHRAYDTVKIANVLKQLEGCLTTGQSVYVFILCFNSHAKLRTINFTSNESKEVIVGIFGSNTDSHITKKSTLIHAVTKSGMGTSYIKQVWDNGNVCDETGAYWSITVFMSCNKIWEGIYNLVKISNCELIAYVYVTSLCKLEVFEDFDHKIDDLERARNVFYCSRHNEKADKGPSASSKKDTRQAHEHSLSKFTDMHSEPAFLKDIILNIRTSHTNDTRDLATGLSQTYIPQILPVSKERD